MEHHGNHARWRSHRRQRQRRRDHGLSRRPAGAGEEEQVGAGSRPARRQRLHRAAESRREGCRLLSRDQRAQAARQGKVALMKKPDIALITAREARGLDEDLPPLEHALRDAGAQVHVVDWDDATADWSRYSLALLRSAWDYVPRLPEFLDWAQRTSR